MIHTDCDLFQKDDLGRSPYCKGLTEMMCANGECKFYKTTEQVAEERMRCRERIMRIRYFEHKNQKTMKEVEYGLFSTWY